MTHGGRTEGAELPAAAAAVLEPSGLSAAWALAGEGVGSRPFCGCCILARPCVRGVLSLGEYATGLMTGPELSLPPPAVNGLAILLMVVLGANEYFG